jgi:ketosteroid isomerase-like protein
LGAIDETQLTLAIETFDADEALRREDPSEVMETDDVVAMTQPALVHFVQHHLEEAIEQAGESPDLEAFDHVYRTVLVEVVALSHAVVPPEGLVTSGPALA